MTKWARFGAVAFALLFAFSGAAVVAYDYTRSNPEPEELVAAIGPKVDSAEQQPAFDDGEITFDEYRDANFAHVECLKSKGFTVSAPALDGERQRYEYTKTFKGDENDAQYIQDASLECYTTHLSEIDKVWSAANAPSPASLMDAQRALAACLREKGIDAPEDPGMGDLRPFLLEGDRRFADCSRAVSEEFGLPGFGGF